MFDPFTFYYKQVTPLSLKYYVNCTSHFSKTKMNKKTNSNTPKSPFNKKKIKILSSYTIYKEILPVYIFWMFLVLFWIVAK